ncbi:luciferase [Mycobacterium vulneris]|uniref:LLM class flavin-dependent oxidoreductase n=1 Tax=Mycolicibacterium septicum DSM 44393 TaxID=1341646 RepID=A0A7X6RYW3_9MYCO|nr:MULTISPECIES: LLM class flavin-dependent oxidoreductase [Mycolicibacterium]MBX8688785.1 LLM class flavin-dependent oxidoreductase [Mycobacterium sp. 20091114027_K0903767]OCB47906.1 luciferase [Mycolicibacterium vulneris]NKZ14934.1 LLM class flavin-dependent oxidoreductase [Mycolicibacterium septicum DSM 44393]OBK07203.1 luciferase [Mycolicibacterium fortuitum]OBK59503.1 luciferase [Mycolicibacterium fortuitum]
MSTYGLSLIAPTLAATAALAADADAAGFDAVWASEFYVRSATVSMAAVAQATRACRIGSSIMYGVGRSPLVLATEARDLDELSDGRIVLGIGNGTKRMMSDWHSVADTEAPALRIEELVPLIRRIWNLHDGPVQHRGRFYNMNLIPSGPVDPPARAIPIITAAVRPRMCEAAGRVADGLAGHPLFTTGYVEQIVRPAVAKGAARADRNPADIEIVSMVMCSIHDDPVVARREVAQQIAFYAAVKTYEPLLDFCGFATQGEQIREAFSLGDFPAMFDAVTDDMIDVMGVAGTANDVRDGLRRYEGVLDHIMLYPPSVGIAPQRVQDNLSSLIEVRRQ